MDLRYWFSYFQISTALILTGICYIVHLYAVEAVPFSVRQISNREPLRSLAKYSSSTQVTGTYSTAAFSNIAFLVTFYPATFFVVFWKMPPIRCRFLGSDLVE